MIAMIAALAETTGTTDYNETLGPLAYGLVAVILVVAAVVAWVITPRGDSHH